MENGHTENGNGVVAEGYSEDSIEFHILMAYARRRRPSDKRLQRQDSISTPTPTPLPNDELPDTTPKKKKKFRLKWPSCIRPKTKDSDGNGPAPASLDSPGGQLEIELDKVAGKLTEISTTVPFLDGDLDTDCPQDIVQELAKLLRESGDKLNEKIKNDKVLLDRLQNSFNYSFFSRVMTTFFGKLNLASTERPEEAQIAMTCEVVTRLSTMDTLPVSQTMGYGERYLQDYFSPWVKQHGGWEQAFNPDDDDEEVH